MSEKPVDSVDVMAARLTEVVEQLKADIEEEIKKPKDMFSSPPKVRSILAALAEGAVLNMRLTLALKNKIDHVKE